MKENENSQLPYIFHLFSCQTDLLHYAELIPTISTQLRIVASVKSVNIHDETVRILKKICLFE